MDTGLAGTWENTQQGITFQVNEDSSYQISFTNGHTEKGRYTVQNQSLILLAETGQQNIYTIQTQDAYQLSFTDPNGTNYQFQRQGAPQNYAAPVNEADIQGATLAEASGKTLKQGHVDIYTKFTQFVIGQKLTPAEQKMIQDECVESFQEDAQAVITDALSTAQAMQQIYALQDPAQIGAARVAFISEMHKIKMQGDEDGSILQIVNKYAPVIAFDNATGLALTQKDLNGLVDVMGFLNAIGTNTAEPSEQQKQVVKQQLLSNFNNLSLEEKQSLCMGSVLNEVTRAQWNNLSQQEQAQARQQMQQQVQPNTTANNDDWLNEYLGDNSYSNPKLDALRQKLNAGTITQAELIAYQNLMQQEQQMWTMMSNMQQQTHVTTMNIIENMGDGGGYWEVVDY